jgi:hypothetical protein
LAEASAARLACWETPTMPALRGNGKGAQKIASLFEGNTAKSKNVAYGWQERLGIGRKGNGFCESHCE